MNSIKIGKHIGKKTINEIQCNVVIVDQSALNYPILLVTEDQLDKVCSKKDTVSILNFKTGENMYACNGIRNYLNDNGITVEKVVYLDGFLKIVIDDDRIKKSDILKLFNIPRTYGYFPMERGEVLLIDLEEYEDDISERKSLECM